MRIEDSKFLAFVLFQQRAPAQRPLRPSWSALGGLLGVLGASESRKGENAKHIEKHMKINDFGFLGPSWEASWMPSWAVLGASWAVLGPSCASWADLWTSRGPLEPS